MSRRSNLTLAVILLVLASMMLALAGCGSAPPAAPLGATPSQQPAYGSAPTTAPVDSGTPSSGAVKVGQKIMSGEWALTVKSVTFSTAAGGAKAAAGKQLAVLALELVNTASSPQGIGPASFKLKSADGTSNTAAETNDPTFIFNTPLPIKPGEKRIVKIAYQVPTGAKAFALTFAPYDPAGKASPVVVNIK